MSVNDIPLLITSLLFFIIGTALLLYWAKRGGYFYFLTNAHYYSLGFLLVAGVFTWLGMVFPVNPDRLTISKQQWAALGFSVGISLLWWLRYVFSIAPATELEEST